jgi:hypothetical protein
MFSAQKMVPLRVIILPTLHGLAYHPKRTVHFDGCSLPLFIREIWVENRERKARDSRLCFWLLPFLSMKRSTQIYYFHNFFSFRLQIDSSLPTPQPTSSIRNHLFFDSTIYKMARRNKNKNKSKNDALPVRRSLNADAATFVPKDEESTDRPETRESINFTNRM